VAFPFAFLVSGMVPPWMYEGTRNEKSQWSRYC
jgi:hypothetical protein